MGKAATWLHSSKRFGQECYILVCASLRISYGISKMTPAEFLWNKHNDARRIPLKPASDPSMSVDQPTFTTSVPWCSAVTTMPTQLHSTTHSRLGTFGAREAISHVNFRSHYGRQGVIGCPGKHSDSPRQMQNAQQIISLLRRRVTVCWAVNYLMLLLVVEGSPTH
jgi:hypothetical protein